MSLRSIPWPRFLIEGLVIVGSILLAFAIDAAWDARQEAELDRAYLETVRSDLRATRVLLDEAITAHDRTVEVGRTLLVTDWGVEPAWDTLQALLGASIPSYIINAPLGGIEAASTSGSIGRLGDATLREQLTRWPGYIDDLLEEELNGSRVANEEWIPWLATHVPMEGVHSVYDGMVSGGAGNITVEQLDLPRQDPPADLGALLRSMEFRNRILEIIYNARASVGEARYFRAILDEILSDLDAALEP